MATKVIKYPLDPTGSSDNNKVMDEPHIVPRDKSRTFATFYGPFYTDSLVVREKNNTVPLTKGSDYRIIGLDPEATISLGLPVATAIIITNTALGSDFEIDYQVVGGPFSLSSDAIAQGLATLDIDSRTVSFNSVLGKPVRYPPAPHLHSADDLYGMDYVISALEDLREAVLQGDVASHEQLYDYIDNVKTMIYIDIDKTNVRIDTTNATLAQLRAEYDALVAGDIATLKAQMAQHLADQGNPHRTNKEQVGLGVVENYPPANNAQADDETNSTTYLTPSSFWSVLRNRVLVWLNQHIGDHDNPHQTTKAQVGLSDVDNYATASQVIAEQGQANTYFMTPLRTKQLVDALYWPIVTAHINDHNNPHQTTPLQIGAVPITRTINGQPLSGDIMLPGVRPGVIVMWGSDNIPDGWLVCNGQGIPGTMPRLRALYGNNVPDLRGVFVRGKDSGRGVDPDPWRGMLSWQPHGIQNITGSFSADARSLEGGSPTGAFYATGGNSYHTKYDGGGGFTVAFDASRQIQTAPETRPVNVALHFIIATDYVGGA